MTEHRDNDVFLIPNIDSIDLMGKVMLCVGRTANGYVFREPNVELQTVLTSVQIKQFHRSGKLAFVSPDEVRLPVGVREALRVPLRAFEAKQRKEIFRRLRYVMRFDKLGADFSRSEDCLQPVCDAVAKEREEKAPDWFTVYRWWLVWSKAGRDPRALKRHDDRKGNRDAKLEDFKIAAIRDAIDETWLARRRPSIGTAQAAANATIAKKLGGHEAVQQLIREGKPSLVSYKTVREHCRKMGRQVRLYRRHGRDATRQEITPVGAGPKVCLPFERVEADFKYLRLFVIDDASGLPLGTPYVMAVVDCYSGAIAGFDISFDPPGRTSTARALKHTVGFKDLSGLPKDEDGQPIVRNSWPINGVPLWFFLDNDVAFHSKHFFAAAKTIGCLVDFIPPGEAWKKGTIETFWRSSQKLYFEMFPGLTLRFYDKPGRDYAPEDDAVVMLSDVVTFFTKAVVDHHNQGVDEESGIRRIDLWLQGVAAHRPKQPRNHDDLMELVGCYEDRKAERRGIRIFGLRYNCKELAMFRAGFQEDPRVEVRYDPDNLGKVWVIDSKNGRALPIPCTRPDYAEGLSLNQHRIIRAHAVSRYGGRKILMKELLLSRAELFALGQKMIGSVKSGRKRKKLAHFFGADRSILDAYTYRGEDPETSKGHILDGDSAPSGQADNDARGFDIHSDIDDPEDETQARRDEAFVDSVVDGEPKPSDRPAARRKAGRPAARGKAGRPAASASTGERVEGASASSTAPAESRPEPREPAPPPRPVPPAPPPAPRAAPEAPESRRDAPKRPRVLADDD